MRREHEQIRIGDVFMMKFGGSGSEQTGWRPGLVFQNNKGNGYSPNIIALPLTSSIKKMSQPTHVLIPRTAGLKLDSVVLCENPERMSKERIGKYITTLSHEYMEKIAIASLLATSAIAFVSPDALLAARQTAISLNATSVVA
ncbi:MAG: type II toxin-antitoxin system PemK/MazF family toxin [Parabacteroides sp.]|nr:type II toxin-antitoxin system PemK/MazF family toxin [Parabacteroides sp.]